MLHGRGARGGRAGLERGKPEDVEYFSLSLSADSCYTFLINPFKYVNRHKNEANM